MNAFTPRNDLEKLLIEMHQGEVSPENFARRFVDVEIFMPIKDEKHQIAGFQMSTKAQPLVVEDEDGNRVLVAFSAPEHAKEFVADYPGHGGGLLVEVSWLLRRMGENVALSLNPGMEIGFDFDAEMIAMLASLLPEEDQ